MNNTCRRYLTTIAALLMLCLATNGMAQKREFVVVIDAGHGGTDPGALGKKYKEKDINLGVALKLGNLIEKNCSNTKVVYTRNKDVFVPLIDRAKIANKAGADLFISIHANSLDYKNKARTTTRGASTYTLGLSSSSANLDVAKRENSVILLEEDFSTKYEGFDPKSSESYIIFEFLQDKHMEQSVNFASAIQKEFVQRANRVDRGVKQAGLLVLKATSMPAVLIELDFICNPTEEQFMGSTAGQNKLADSIYRAFVSYKADYDRKQQAQLVEHGSVVRNTPTAVETTYRIQIIASPKKIATNSKEFKGLSPINYYQENGLYKYTYLDNPNLQTVKGELKSVQKKFKGAFIVTFKDGVKAK